MMIKMIKNMKNNDSGFTLLEVLVAILVLSFGLLGVAGLLLATVQNNTIAAQRTTATFLAQDMAERIRQNINATKPFDPAGVARTVNYIQASVPANINCYGTASVAACATPQGAANRDIFIWQQQIARSLPAGQGVVCKDLTPDDGISLTNDGCDAPTSQSPWVIKIFWVVRGEDQAAGGGSNNVQRFSMMMGGT